MGAGVGIGEKALELAMVMTMAVGGEEKGGRTRKDGVDGKLIDER